VIAPSANSLLEAGCGVLPFLFNGLKINSTAAPIKVIVAGLSGPPGWGSASRPVPPLALRRVRPGGTPRHRLAPVFPQTLTDFRPQPSKEGSNPR